MSRTAEEKQATRDTRNKRRREAYTKASLLESTVAVTEAKAVGATVDVGTLSRGDKFILDKGTYIVLRIDSETEHIHATLLQDIPGEEEVPDGKRAVDFGTQVSVIAAAHKGKGAVEAPVPDAELPPAVGGGRWYK